MVFMFLNVNKPPEFSCVGRILIPIERFEEKHELGPPEAQRESFARSFRVPLGWWSYQMNSFHFQRSLVLRATHWRGIVLRTLWLGRRTEWLRSTQSTRPTRPPSSRAMWGNTKYLSLHYRLIKLGDLSFLTSYLLLRQFIYHCFMVRSNERFQPWDFGTDQMIVWVLGDFDIGQITAW